MTLSALPSGATAEVSADRRSIRIHDLTITNAEAAGRAMAYLDNGGADALADALRRAIPVGLVALSLTAASLDSSSLQRTLDEFARDVDQRSRQTLTGLDELLCRLRAGEQSMQAAAQQTLDRLPQRLDQVLADEAVSVREAVTNAARQVHAATLDDVRRALAQHSQSVQQVLSLDGDGPVHTLRRDLLAQLDTTRRELTEQFAVVRELLSAAEASKAASVKSTRAVGDSFEAQAVALAERIVTAAGDRWEATGSQPAPGSTCRVGDGVATLTSAITGRSPVRIVVEAKHRSRPLTASAWQRTLAEARSVRGAAGALALVPSADQVPGSGAAFCRVDDLSFVVVADTERAEIVYLVLRELVALIAVRQQDGAEIDLTKVEAQINAALSALSEFDEVGRLTNAALKNLASVKEIGARVKSRITESLTAGIAALHP